MDSTKSIVWAVIALIVILGGGYFLLSGSVGPETGNRSQASDRAVVKVPALSQDELLGKTEVSSAALDAVAEHKADILKRVRSGKSLTQEEKGAIGNVMLTEAHIYKFTDEERDEIFAALQW